MSLFTGKTGLRHQYLELKAADLAGATDAASAKLIGRVRSLGRLAYIDSTLRDSPIPQAATPATVQLLLVHPDQDDSTANRLEWIRIEAPKIINYATMGSGLEFDPGTRIYAFVHGDSEITAAQTDVGFLKVVLWG